MKIFAICMQKGGTGKTETSLNLAYACSAAGYRTLFVDMDPQANATSVIQKISMDVTVESYRKMREDYDNSSEPNQLYRARKILKKYVYKKNYTVEISDVLEKPILIEEAILETSYENLHILPASQKLGDMDIKIKMSGKHPAGRLRLALNQVRDKYDVVIIDNSPFENALTYNSFCACMQEGDTIIIPAKINQGGLEGLDRTIDTLIEWLEYETLRYDFKILITMRNNNLVDHAGVQTIRHLFGERVYETTIRYQAKPVSEAGLKKEILIASTKDNIGVINDYREWAQEVLKEIEK